MISFRSIFVATIFFVCSASTSHAVNVYERWLSPEEQVYLKKQEPRIEDGLYKITRKHVEAKSLSIALLGSGGGYRAMIAFLGFLIGAYQIHLLDASKYMAGLSGSTWTLGSLLVRHMKWGGESKNVLPRFRSQLQKLVAQKFLNFKNLNWKALAIQLGAKWLAYEAMGFRTPIRSADLWGALITNKIMADMPYSGQLVTFSDIQNFLKKIPLYPFPLFSASIKRSIEETKKHGYRWFEVNPFRAGSKEGYIDTEYLGANVFNDGVCTESVLTKEKFEEKLSFWLGIFGSPYDLNPGDIARQVAEAMPIKFGIKSKIVDLIDYLIAKFGLADDNFLPSPICNPTYNIMSSPFFDEKHLLPADAGLAFNLPVPTVGKRGIDMYFICDASSDDMNKYFDELRLAKKYADNNRIPFPSIKHYDKIAPNVLVFKYNENGHISPKIPTVVYFRNPHLFKTTKMSYSKDEFKLLCDDMTKMVTDNKNNIAYEIIHRLEVKAGG